MAPSTPFFIRIHATLILVILATTARAWVLPKHAFPAAQRAGLLSHPRPLFPRAPVVRIPWAPLAASRSSTPNDDEEEECDSEEECEIDWDNMPGFDNDEEEATKIGQESSQASPIIEYNDFEDDLIFPLADETSTTTSKTTMTSSNAAELKTAPTDDRRASKSKQPVGSTRKTLSSNSNMNWKHGMARMEMQWQMTESAKECDVDMPETCGSKPCQACQGRGHTACRLCRGTHFMKLGPDSDFMACKLCDENGQEICHACQGSGWVAEWTNLGPTVTHKGSFGDMASDSDALRP